MNIRPTRRRFLRTSAVLAAAPLVVPKFAHAAGAGQIRIGLIGCGGRGTGAAINALNAGPDVVLVSMADLFKDHLDAAAQRIKTGKPDQMQVKPEECFVGLDGYKQLIPTVDVVLIAVSSVFHPRIFRAAVDANKHIFCEKPHGIDVPSVKDFLAAADDARKRKLNVVSGLCWRYDLGMRETVKRIQDGAIGEVIAIQENYLSRPYVIREKQPGWSEMEFQFRNWYHFNYLSGDQTAQQLIHSIDKASWVLGDKPPVKVQGMGGRQACTQPMYGDQFDHHSVVFEYENGVKVFGFTRDMTECFTETNDFILGTKGRCRMMQHEISGQTNWKFEGQKPSMYDEEHKALFDSIRAGKVIDNSGYGSLSTLLAIAAQIACYSGQLITWEQLLKSQRRLLPEGLSLESEPPVKADANGMYPAPIPGKAELAKWMM